MKKELKSYSCNNCNKFVAFDGVVKYKKKAYHGDCFVCSICNTPLSPAEKTFEKRRNKALVCHNCLRNQKRSRFPGQSLMASPSKIWRKKNTVKRSEPFKEANSKTSEVDQLFNKHISWDHEAGAVGFSVIFPEAEIFQFSKIEEKLTSLKENYPNNFLAKRIDDSIIGHFEDESLDVQIRFFNCVSAALAYPHTRSIGVLAMDSSDYIDMRNLFFPLIKIWNKMHPMANFEVNPEELAKQHKQPLSCSYNINKLYRVERDDIKGIELEFIRNLEEFSLVGGMSLEERVNLENHLIPVFELLKKTSYRGRIVKSTNTNLVSTGFGSSYTEASTKDVSFEDFLDLRNKLNPFVMEKMRHKLGSRYHGSKIANNFPNASGVYVSQDKKFRIYYNEVDHIRFEFFQKSSLSSLGARYSLLIEFINDFEKCYRKIHERSIKYLISDELGFITSCPSKLGSAFVPAIFLDLPELAEQDEVRSLARRHEFKFKRDISNKLGGLFKIYPSSRVYNTEEMAIKSLFTLLPKLLSAEAHADEI